MEWVMKLVIAWLKKHWFLLFIGFFNLVGVVGLLAIAKSEWFSFLAAEFTGSGTTIATIGLALSTSWLVYVTYRLVRENQQQRDDNERIRKEDRQREISLRIREWAEDSFRLLCMIDTEKTFDMKLLHNIYHFITLKGLAINKNLEILQRNTELDKLIDKALKLSAEQFAWYTKPDADKKVEDFAHGHVDLMFNLVEILKATL
jgi:hypothetical protein